MKHQTQLTGIPTQSVDCGTRTTSMGIDWMTNGVKVPSIKIVRTRMGAAEVWKPGADLSKLTTNPNDWARCIESFDTAAELERKFEPPLTGRIVSAGSWSDIDGHLDDGKLVLAVVHYGIWRRLMPRKSGSKTFSGYHAIPLLPRRGDTISYDPLLDGRYTGCPRGPVAVGIGKVREAMEAVGVKEGVGKRVYAYLPEKATALGGVPVPPPAPEEPDITLASILADMYELLDAGQKVQGVIDDLEALIGPYRGEAGPDDEPDEAVSLPK